MRCLEEKLEYTYYKSIVNIAIIIGFGHYCLPVMVYEFSELNFLSNQAISGVGEFSDTMTVIPALSGSVQSG